MKKTWARKFKSFAEAERAESDYYLKMSPEERLDIMQFLRGEYFKINRRLKNEAGTGLRRTIKIIQQA